MSKIHTNGPEFWQRPNISFDKDSIWYEQSPIGKNTLGDRVKVLSSQVGLSKVYTNHLLKATRITVLDRSGFEARHIMVVSDHQSEISIRSYASYFEDKKKNIWLSIFATITGHKGSQPSTRYIHIFLYYHIVWTDIQC